MMMVSFRSGVCENWSDDPQQLSIVVWDMEGFRDDDKAKSAVVQKLTALLLMWVVRSSAINEVRIWMWRVGCDVIDVKESE